MGQIAAQPGQTTLRNALLQFCFATRIEDVTFVEQHFTSQELAERGYPNLGGTPNRGEKEPAASLRQGAGDRLQAAWRGLLLDFRSRLERGDVIATGVQVRPQPQIERTIIPGQWAADFRIDVLKNTIDFQRTRYVSILVGLPDAFPEELGPCLAAQTATFDPSTIGTLSDDGILLLLEEHAKRVVEGPDAKLIAPGKISLMPIIRRKMLARAQAGELLPKLADETKWLANWIATKVESFHAPTVKSIGNSLREHYRTASAQSKGTKP